MGGIAALKGNFWAAFCFNFSPIEVRDGRSYFPSRAGCTYDALSVANAYMHRTFQRLRDTYPTMNATLPGAQQGTPQAPAPAAQAGKLPPRTPFTAADDAVAAIHGMPDARFFADSET